MDANILKRLMEPFPEEAIERTKTVDTHKGYDTTGIKYQHVVNRLNEVLGVGGFRVAREFVLRDKKTRSGFPMIEATCDLTMQLGQWANGEFLAFAEAVGTGGHTSSTEADAKKGAFTNGFKKVAAMFGCGWQAYAGCIDDDNAPADESAPAPVATPAPKTTRQQLEPATDAVLGMILAARDAADLKAAVDEALKLPADQQKLLRPPYTAKQKELKGAK